MKIIILVIVLLFSDIGNTIGITTMGGVLAATRGVPHSTVQDDDTEVKIVIKKETKAEKLKREKEECKRKFDPIIFYLGILLSTLIGLFFGLSMRLD